jgi:hypothetical protein
MNRRIGLYEQEDIYGCMNRRIWLYEQEDMVV